MISAEAVTAVRSIVEACRARPEGSRDRAVLVLRRTGRPPGGERVRLLPGVLGWLLCINADGGIVVDVRVAALERWLERNGGRAAPRRDARAGR